MFIRNINGVKLIVECKGLSYSDCDILVSRCELILNKLQKDDGHDSNLICDLDYAFNKHDHSWMIFSHYFYDLDLALSLYKVFVKGFFNFENHDDERYDVYSKPELNVYLSYEEDMCRNKDVSIIINELRHLSTIYPFVYDSYEIIDDGMYKNYIFYLCIHDIFTSKDRNVIHKNVIYDLEVFCDDNGLDDFFTDIKIVIK